jgi:hypothetical protein
MTLLRPFGRHWRWRETDDAWIAHPWLVYPELLRLGESRALEAALQVREREFGRLGA